jgi:nucleotide-binding universal stress UspA family protein
MATPERRPVVVGVDGGVGSEGALRYAVAEAVLRDEGLRVVHVWPGSVPEGLRRWGEWAGPEAAGRALLDHAVETAACLAPSLRVSTELVVGPRSAGILAAARGGRLLVVGRPSRLHPDLPLGPTPSGVAARAECPTVVVPSSWMPEPTRGLVVVGMKSRTHARELLSHAFEDAQLRGARVEVVTAWGLYDPTMDRAEARTNSAEWQADGTRVLEELVAEWRRRYPAVPVELRVVHGRAATVLMDASAEADLLLIARRRHPVPPYGRLGGTAHAVLRSSTTPVEVVPADAVADAPEPCRPGRPG